MERVGFLLSSVSRKSYFPSSDHTCTRSSEGPLSLGSSLRVARTSSIHVDLQCVMRHALLFAPILSCALGSFAGVARREKMSFAHQLQKTYSAEDLLLIAAQQPKPTPQDAVRFLQRLMQLIPKGPSHEVQAIKIRQDIRLSEFLSCLAVDRLSAEEIATLIWSSAVIQRPLRRSEVPKEDLLTAVDAAAEQLEVHRAAELQWAWESIGRDVALAARSRATWPAAPARLVERTAALPFAVHVGAMDTSLLSLESLLAETSPQRDVIKSGSATPSKETLAETRLTAWQSEAGLSFTYSGKAMPPRVGDELRAGLSPTIASIRGTLADKPIERWYDSVLVNYYEGGKVGMRFHSDPGQGDEGPWGYSTCVVSAGDCRQFTFRRIGDPSQRCTFALRGGDVVEMFGSCQQLYQHSVKTEASDEAAGPRISLVFKRTQEAEAERARGERPEGRQGQ